MAQDLASVCHSVAHLVLLKGSALSARDTGFVCGLGVISLLVCSPLSQKGLQPGAASSEPEDERVGRGSVSQCTANRERDGGWSSLSLGGQGHDC